MNAGCERPPRSLDNEARDATSWGTETRSLATDHQAAIARACAKSASTASRRVDAAPPGLAAPTLLSDREVYGIGLAPQGTESGGTVLFEPDRGGEHLIYLGTPRMPLSVRELSTGATIEPNDDAWLDCDKLKRALSFDFERGETYALSFGPIAPQRWVRLYAQVPERDIRCDEIPASSQVDRACEGRFASTSVYTGDHQRPELEVERVYVLDMDWHDESNEAVFVPPHSGRYDLYLGAPNIAYSLVQDGTETPLVPMCNTPFDEVVCDAYRAVHSYDLVGGVPHTLAVAPDEVHHGLHHLRVAFYPASAMCDADNGGCDPLTTCEPVGDHERVCGPCPAGYSGHGETGCVDIDECREDTDVCDDDPDACVNLEGAYDCVCPEDAPGVGVGSEGCGGEPSPALTLGYQFGCAVWDDGAMKCWGNNDHGQLGLGDRENRGDEPGEMGPELPFVATDGPVRQAATAFASTCALGEDGRVRCWGSNDHGQLGIGSSTSRIGTAPAEMGPGLHPVALGTDVRAAKLAATGDSYCALTEDDAIKCWGRNRWGQLGVGDTRDRGEQPEDLGDALAAVDLGSEFVPVDLTCGWASCCARSEAGELKCWGSNYYGDLGLGLASGQHIGDEPGEMGDTLPAVDLGTDRSATSIVAHDHGFCALLDDGGLKCWGRGTDGATGLGVDTNWGDAPGEMGDNLPYVDLGPDQRPLAIAQSRGSVVCAVLPVGALKCWGIPFQGSLGFPSPSPVGDSADEMGDFLPFIALGTGRAVAAAYRGHVHGCVLLDNGAVKCWGSNRAGALGLGDTQHRGWRDGEMGDALPEVDLGR
ncbi:MAG: hypothetical protein B7733_17240 [Myxococcales bacterium FL481]|nr:MAG: hypothetical protein B7733_17240 [Myxococcales bacterium FL481]